MKLTLQAGKQGLDIVRFSDPNMNRLQSQIEELLGLFSDEREIAISSNPRLLPGG